jgi:hypothetical protein
LLVQAGATAPPVAPTAAQARAPPTPELPPAPETTLGFDEHAAPEPINSATATAMINIASTTRFMKRD